MIHINEEFLRVLKGKPDTGVLVVPILQIRRVEDRIAEIANVTPHKAPELLATFNRAYLDLDQYIRQIEMELVYARQRVSTIKAEIILDRADEIFKQRGLKASADLRQAVVDLDEGYQKAVERVGALEAAREYLKGKQKSIEMAYGSVRKILGEGTYNHRNTNLNGNVDYSEQIGKTDNVRSYFGTAEGDY